MEQNLNGLRKQSDKLHLISWLSLFGILILGSMDMFFIITFILDLLSRTIDGKILEYIVKVTACTCLVYATEIVMNKSSKQEKEVNEKIASIEDDMKKKEIMEDIKRKFELLSRDKQLQLLQFVKNDESLRTIVPQINALDEDNQKKIQAELDLIYNGISDISVEITGNNYLEYVMKQLESFYYENPGQMVSAVMNDIKQDKSLLKYYFSYIDWSRVSLDDVYERLFCETKDMKKSTGFCRKKTERQ